MDDLDFLQSRPLLGFQLDGSHLNTVLQNIIQHQQQLLQGQRQTLQRLDDLEYNVKDLRDHCKDMDRVLSDVSGAVDPNFFNQLKGRLGDLENAMDRVIADLADTKGTASAAGKDADQAGRLAEQANRAIVPLQDAIQDISKEVDNLGRQCTQDRRDVGRALDEIAGSREEQDKMFADALRDLQQKADRMGRENGVEKLRQMLEDLSNRTDENFRTVEESARAVDNELTRQANELGAMHSELGAMEDRNNKRLSALAADTDDKYNALLNAFREYERSSSELEEHLALAGQALARRRHSPSRSSRQ